MKVSLVLEVNVIHSKLKITKGVSKVVVKKSISFDDDKNFVLNDKPKNVKINAIRTLKINKLLIDSRQTRPIKQRW